MTEVRFYDPMYIPAAGLTYSVIVARIKGKWIFVRHHERTTWEIPGGHIEQGETPDEAAARELHEETGARSFNLENVATYSVTVNGSTGYGRLFFAEVTEIGPVADISEIVETMLEEQFPDNLTYPDIQPHLFKKVIDFLDDKEKL